MPTEERIKSYAEILQFLSTHEESMSVSGWSSLTRAYVALYNLVVRMSLDKVLGRQDMHLKRIKHLHDLCLKKYGKEQDFMMRCRLLRIMQLLANEPFSPYAPWKEECFSIGEQFILDYMPSHRNCTLWEWLWCIAYQYYPLSETTTNEYGFRMFKKHLSAWISDFDEEEGWAGLPLLDALKRIDLLNANSYMFLDDTYNDALCLLYAHYRSQVPVSPTTDVGNLHAMGLLYELVHHFTAYPFDRSKKEASIQGLEDSLNILPLYSDQWLYVFSYLVYDLCEYFDGDIYML